MREIKFRAKDTGGEWHYGDLELPRNGERNPHIHAYKENGEYDRQYPINDDTVGQFTGLRDKNGKEIYEGDIVRHQFSNDMFGVVKWHPLGYFYIDVHWDMCEKDDGYLPLGEVTHRIVNGKKIEIEVIGNVYDNKDLLNENKHGKKY